MVIKEISISLSSQEIQLNNQRSAFWPSQSALIVADLHIGKAAHFRKNGIAIPQAQHDNDLERLYTLLHHYQADKLIIVGDLFHAGHNKEVDNFKEWLYTIHPVQTLLIKGNHDNLPVRALQQIGLQEVRVSKIIAGIKFIHTPATPTHHPQITGHIHPGVKLILPPKKIIRLPAFVLSRQQLLLPAFSSFTGLDTNITLPDARYFAFNEKEIFEI